MNKIASGSIQRMGYLLFSVFFVFIFLLFTEGVEVFIFMFYDGSLSSSLLSGHPATHHLKPFNSIYHLPIRQIPSKDIMPNN